MHRELKRSPWPHGGRATPTKESARASGGGILCASAAQARQEEVLGRLAAIGYKNVEPVDYTNVQGVGVDGYRTLLDRCGLKASALHSAVSMATADAQWLTTVDEAKTLGVRYVGAAADPRNFRTADQWVAVAKKIDHFGELARERGVRSMVHSHNWEFTSVFGTQTADDILQQCTSPQNVVFELDLYLATKAGVNPIDILDRSGNRIALLNVRDMAPDGSITTVGKGTIDFALIFAAADTRPRVGSGAQAAADPDDPFGVAVVESDAGAGVEGGDAGHLLVGQGEVEDVEVLRHPLGTHGLGDDDDAALQQPAQGDLGDGPAVSIADADQGGGRRRCCCGPRRGAPRTRSGRRGRS